MEAHQSTQRPPALDAMDEEDLLACLAEARDRDDPELTREVMGRLVWGRYDMLVALARSKLDAKERSEAEDIAQETFVSALAAGFRGETPGELFAFLKTILARRIADMRRRRIPDPASDGEVDGELVDIVDSLEGGDDPADLVPTLDVALSVIGELSELHARIVVLYLRERLSASEICDRLSGEGMSVSQDNVHQVISRYRKQVRVRLDIPEASRGPR